jgi:hypothetical protein
MRKTCHIHRGRPTAFADNGSGGVPGPNNLFITSAVEHPDGNVPCIVAPVTPRPSTT